MAKKKKRKIPTWKEVTENEDKYNIAKKRCIKALRVPKTIPITIIKEFIKSQDSFVRDTSQETAAEIRKSFWETIYNYIHEY